jgi:hypothetical protein
MTAGTSTYMGLALASQGEINVTQQTVGTDIVTITGKTGITGKPLNIQTYAGVSLFSVNSVGSMSVAGSVTHTGTLVQTGASTFTAPIAKMILGTVALASLASNASATVALTGLTSSMAALIFTTGAGDITNSKPQVWCSATDKLGYMGGGVTTAAATVAYWAFTTI